MNFDGKEMQEEFNAAFGNLHIATHIEAQDYRYEDFDMSRLNASQLWWLVKFAKHIRMRCRNNSAFNNYMNRNFPNATFREVTKHRKDGSTYQGLSISVNGQEVSEEEE